MFDQLIAFRRVIISNMLETYSTYMVGVQTIMQSAAGVQTQGHDFFGQPITHVAGDSLAA